MINFFVYIQLFGAVQSSLQLDILHHNHLFLNLHFLTQNYVSFPSFPLDILPNSHNIKGEMIVFPFFPRYILPHSHDIPVQYPSSQLEILPPTDLINSLEKDFIHPCNFLSAILQGSHTGWRWGWGRGSRSKFQTSLRRGSSLTRRRRRHNPLVYITVGLQSTDQLKKIIYYFVSFKMLQAES